MTTNPMVATPRLDMREVAVAEDAQRDQRLAGVDRLPVDERRHDRDRRRRSTAQIHGAQSWDWPSCSANTIRNIADARQHHAGHVETLRCWVGSAGTSQTASDQTDDADRHVDDEDPLPAQAVHQHPAGERTDQGRHARRWRPRRSSRHRGAARGNIRVITAIVCGVSSAAPTPCTTRAATSMLDAAGQPAPQRRGGEHRQPDQVHVLGPEPVTQPAGDQQRHRVGQQVGAGHPDDRVVVGVQVRP